VVVLGFVLAPRRAEGLEPAKMTCYEGESYSRYLSYCRWSCSALLPLPPHPERCGRLFALPFRLQACELGDPFHVGRC
jgi:hypothetical protein